MGVYLHGQVLPKHYLQTPTSFSSKYQSSFEAITTKHPIKKTLPTKDKLEAE